MSKEKNRMNDLADWADVIRRQGEERIREVEEFNKRLREPDLVKTNECGDVVAYWRCEQGIIQMRKNSPSALFVPEYAQLFSVNFVKDMSGLLDVEAKELEKS